MPSVPITNALNTFLWFDGLGAGTDLAACCTSHASTPTPHATRLTLTEMAERRRQGLCYNCDEHYISGHRCTHLFLIELDDFAHEDAPLEDEPKTPRISLHAIARLWGIRMTDTKQMCIVIDTRTLLPYWTQAQHTVSSN